MISLCSYMYTTLFVCVVFCQLYDTSFISKPNYDKKCKKKPGIKS